MTDRVLARAWQAYAHLLEDRAPRSFALIEPPAADPTYACRALGLGDHDVVSTWFALHNGSGLMVDASMLLPENLVSSQDAAIATSQLVAGIWADWPAGQTQATNDDPDRAGEVVGTWLSRGYLMIGDDTTGGGLFLDLRDGPRYGCVRWWDKVETDEWGIAADSLADLIVLTAEALRTGSSVGTVRPTVVDGELSWAPPGDT